MANEAAFADHARTTSDLTWWKAIKLLWPYIPMADRAHALGKLKNAELVARLCPEEV